MPPIWRLVFLLLFSSWLKSIHMIFDPRQMVLVRSKGQPQCPVGKGPPRILFKKSQIPLPELLGKNIYALVRPKQTSNSTEELTAAHEYQEDALERLIRCRLNNTKCYKIQPPKPKIDFGKFCWTSQKFEPLRAGISQVRCKAPQRPHDATVNTYWRTLLQSNGSSSEIQVSVSNFFLVKSENSLNVPFPTNWYEILKSSADSIPLLLGQANVKKIDPLNPQHPMNPLFPYSPLNPFLFYDPLLLMSPFNSKGPFFPLNPGSPFSFFNPANPFNALCPTLLLPPSEPLSPWNPASPFFPTSIYSPYNPDNEMSPWNKNFKLAGPPPFSPFSPLNGFFLLSPFSPWYPLGALARIALLPETDPLSPLNPHSPFHPMTALDPQSPFEGLPQDSPLNPLNLKMHPYNIINGEEIPRSLTAYSPAYIPYGAGGYGPGYGGYGAGGAPAANMGSGTSEFAPKMMPEGMLTKPIRTVGRWFYRFKPTEQSIASVNACDPRSPYFAGHAYSPFHPFHPSNPYSLLNPLNALPHQDPRSPYNPMSTNYAGNPESPYNPGHPMNPFNPKSFLFTCQQSGSLHPMNPRSPFYLLNPRSPFNPMNPYSPYNPRHILLSGLEHSHALNPTLRTSPFHPSSRNSPYHPENYQKLNPKYSLNPLFQLYNKINSPIDPFPHLGWYSGVKEDFSLVSAPEAPPGSSKYDQLIPYSSPDADAVCPPPPPAPLPPRPPYYPGYYMWDPAWPSPKYVRTSLIPSNDPIDPEQWDRIWKRLWKMKCRRDANLIKPHSPFGNDFAIVDIPSMPGEQAI